MKQNDPLISIVIPIYNAEKYLKETIESVIAQSYKNFELLLINHACTDNSISIMENYKAKDNRIQIITLDVNKGGPAYPRNIGIDNANGDYIAFLDSDDVWLKEKLEKEVEILADNDYDIIHTLAYTIDTKSNMTGFLNNQRVYNILHPFLNDLTILYCSNYININTVLMKKDKKIKFREDSYLIALEDWFFWIEHLHNGKNFFLLKENLINYRVDMDSMSNRKTDKSYKKAFYLYALLLNDNKISLGLFISCYIINTLKTILRNIKIKLK
ncbi:glycosyltransferase family 2 protein [Sulfurimonas sp. HSL3-2]|uniref:glycosyltransferase family 2 protein n=1 Tax=Hydrocurvibacter mobilis TaxID=3131936 RepID=UPI0031F910AF